MCYSEMCRNQIEIEDARIVRLTSAEWSEGVERAALINNDEFDSFSFEQIFAHVPTR